MRRWMLKEIQDRSVYCTICASVLDLGFKDFHLPFCSSCRRDIIDKELKTDPDSDGDIQLLINRFI